MKRGAPPTNSLGSMALRGRLEEAFGCCRVLPILHQDVEHDAVLVHGAQEDAGLATPVVPSPAAGPTGHASLERWSGRAAKPYSPFEKSWGRQSPAIGMSEAMEHQ